MLLLILVVIVVAIVYAGLSSRLKKIENDIEILKKNKNASAASAPIPIQEAEPAFASAPPANSPAANVAAAVSNDVYPSASKVSSEEASGRLLGRIGIAAVIIGISFFLKYAFDNNWIGPAGRVMIGIVAGIALISLGQYLRRKYIGYSDLLMGGGIGVLYLSVFAAYSFYGLISPLTAGIFMFLITALSFAVSIFNATITLSVVGVIGGFATPFLVNSGNNAMMELFAYLTILNLGIMGVSFFKKWPQLIIVAFLGTVINFVAWFGAYYSADVLLPTLAFCFISFMIFLVAAVARAVTAKTKTDPLDYFLLGGNALAMAIISYILLEQRYEDVLGYAAVFVAVIYMLVAFVVNKSNSSDKALNIFLPGLAVTFLSVAVPLQFSGSWIAVAWLSESFFLYIIASVISNRGFQVMGLVVYILGLLNLFVFNYPRNNPWPFTPFFNSHFIITILAVIVAYAISFMYYRYGSLTVETQKRGIGAFIIIANILTVYALSSQIVFYHNAELARLSERYNSSQVENSLYNTGYDTSQMRQEAVSTYSAERDAVTNRSNTYVSILWAVYAAILTIVGFSRRVVTVRRMGLILFIITAFKVLINVWSLGQIYRIVSFIVFGIIALGASFLYVKFKDRLKAVV